MAWQNKNFAYSTLNGGVLIGDLSLVVTTGANFPATGNFMLVIWDQAYANPSFDATRELVLCTARTADTITITRAQEGTSAKAWNSGDKVAHVYTAALLDALVYLTGAQSLSEKTLVAPTISGLIAGPIESVAWTYYGSTSTFVGWITPLITPYVYYKKIGDLVLVHARLVGTSNAVTASFTVPYAVRNTMSTIVPCYVADNGVAKTTPGSLLLNTASNVITVRTDMATGAWTASGTKLVTTNFWYITA